MNILTICRLNYSSNLKQMNNYTIIYQITTCHPDMHNENMHINLQKHKAIYSTFELVMHNIQIQTINNMKKLRHIQH